jgi:hypothetical protein
LFKLTDEKGTRSLKKTKADLASDDTTIILWNLHLDHLLLRGCNWVNDYLKHNRNVEESDRFLGDDISRSH